MKKNIITYLILLIIFSNYSQTINADLLVFFTGNTFITPVGQNETFNLQVKNLGSNTAENVTCQINVGSCFSYVSATTNTGNFANGIWTIGNLPDGATVSLTMTNVMNTYCNCSYEIYPVVTSTTNDNYLPNNSTSVNYNWDTLSDLDLQCIPYSGDLTIGNTIFLNYNLINHGNDTCANVFFETPNNGLTIVNGISTNGVWDNQSKSWNSILALLNQTYSLQLECIVNDVQNASISGYSQANSFWEFILNNNFCTSVLTNLTTNKNQFKDSIQITPNPAHDVLNISNANKMLKNIVLFDVLGKKIMDISDNFNNVDVSNLQNGLYVLKVETERGENQIFKVLKE